MLSDASERVRNASHISHSFVVAVLYPGIVQVIVNPAVALLVKQTEGTDEHNDAGPTGQWARLRAQQRTYRALREAGVRVAIGGDYGFRQTPQGEQAADIAYFVDYFGYSPKVCETPSSKC